MAGGARRTDSQQRYSQGKVYLFLTQHLPGNPARPWLPAIVAVVLIELIRHTPKSDVAIPVALAASKSPHRHEN
jgi:hypothetical protein